MAQTFTVQKKDGKDFEIEIWSAEELKANCKSADQTIKAKVNGILKALGVPPPNLIHIKPEEKEQVILKAYAENGVPTNGAVKAPAKAAPAAAAKPAQAAPAQAANGSTGAAPQGALAARANKARAAAAGLPAEDSGDLASELRALRKELGSINEKLDALTAANATRDEHDDLRNHAIIAIHDITREILKFSMETHFIARVTGPGGAGLTPEDLLECVEGIHGEFLADVPELPDLELAGLYPEEEEEGAAGNA